MAPSSGSCTLGADPIPVAPMTNPSNARLIRPLQPMPDFVRKALEDRGLTASYEARPAYQRNDWLGWINRAKRPETKAKRLELMLAELAAGKGYMGMEWKG